MSLILSSVASVWPELIKPHPYLLGIFGLIGVLLIVVPLFARSMPETPQVKNSIMGHQIVSHRDVYVVQPSDTVFRREEIQTVPVTPQIKEEKSLDLRLIPFGDNDASIYLEVTNLGERARVSATARIIKRSDGNTFKGFAYEGRWVTAPTWQQWRNGVQEKFVTATNIERGKSKRLKVASVVSEVGIGIQEMELEVINESIRWEAIPRQPQELPYFVLQIDIIDRSILRPVSKTFKVGPRTATGPLQMTEVVA